MLKVNNQLELNFSKYSELYDIVIKPDNFWKQLNNMVDFLFAYEECVKYSFKKRIIRQITLFLNKNKV